MRGTPLTPDYFTNAIKNIDSPKSIVEKGLYFKRYKKIPYNETKSKLLKTDYNNYTFYVIDQSKDDLVDLIEKLDLVVDTEYADKIDSVEIEVGGQRFDKVYLGDAYCNYLENLYQRRIDKLDNGTTKIPLHVCPLLGDSFLVINGSNVHDVTITISTKKDIDPIPLESVSLWGETVTVDMDTRKRIVGDGINTVTQQTQYAGPELIKNGEYKIRFNFNHPGHSIFFHFGKHHREVVSKIKRVCLKFENSFTFYDGPVELLPHTDGYIRINLRGDKPPTLERGYDKGFWNFSLFDNVTLTIYTEDLDEDKGYLAYVFLHSYQILRYVSGMYGLAYSK